MRRILVAGCFIILLVGCGARMVEGLPVEVRSSILHRDGAVVFCMADGSKVQLMGIKIPEYDDGKASEYRAMSRYVLHSLVTGKQLRLQYDAGETETSFPSGYIYAGDVLVNAEMIKRGYAYKTSASPGGRFDTMFQLLEEEAKAEKRGLWGLAPADIWTSGGS